MSEVATFRKNKIELSDYECSKDIMNRVLMAQFTPEDVSVLEEILYSSLRVPRSVLEKNLGMKSAKLLPILEKLTQTGLFTIEGSHVIVNKEVRKYYELQIQKFDEEFKPNLEYLQGLLRKVPIHNLPNWYLISRTASNIFESIIEKYLLTPQTFQRYLMDLNLADPVQQGIMNAVYKSPHLQIDADAMIDKYSLTSEALEEHMLHLEFNFVCCIRYVRVGESYRRVITPFHEWSEYLMHIRNTELTPIIEEERIERERENDFAFLEEMNILLQLAIESPLCAKDQAISQAQSKCSSFSADEYDLYVEHLCQLNLMQRSGNAVLATPDANHWLSMEVSEQAIYFYRHPLVSLCDEGFPTALTNDRAIREAEKSFIRVVDAGWVYFDDFLKGVFIPLNESQTVELKKTGCNWEYKLPEYSDEEKNFFLSLVQVWLFEAGITALGTIDGRDCFCLTPFGKTLFSND